MKIKDEQREQMSSEKYSWTEQQKFGSLSILREIWEGIAPLIQKVFK